jgi:hypothetical protein
MEKEVKRKVLWKRWEYLSIGRLHLIWQDDKGRLFAESFDCGRDDQNRFNNFLSLIGAEFRQKILAFPGVCDRVRVMGKRVPKKLVERLRQQEALSNL